MYENLIETMRFCAKNGDCHDCPNEKPCAGVMGEGLYCEAADAIEELNKKIDFLMNCLYEAKAALAKDTNVPDKEG